MPMVTSALEQNSSFPSQGSDRQPLGGASSSEDQVIQEQARDVTVRESRPTHTFRNIGFMMGGGQVWIYDANGVLTIRDERPRMIAGIAFRVADSPRRRQFPNDMATELRDQIREWEQDERDRIMREQGDANTVLGPDGMYHHRDHLGPVLTGTNGDTLTTNEDTEIDQTLTRNVGIELTGHQLMGLRGTTIEVGNRFVTEALGHPSDMQVSSGLPWS
jgi:hypothetical protein